MKKIIDHPILGQVELSQSRRARRISLSVRPPARVYLSFPPSVSQREAIRFMESKSEWVKDAIAKIDARQPSTLLEMPFSTRTHKLIFLPSGNDQIGSYVADGKIHICYPAVLNYTSDDVQKVAKHAVEDIWRAEAKIDLPQRLSILAGRHGFRHGTVTIRNNRSRWGSCTAHNNISLSLHLMRLPDHLIDYVLLHELCHISIKNHGSGFYELLDSLCCGRHKELNREIRNYSPRW